MASQLGGEARAQVTCFCAASWAVTDPSLNQQAASLTGGLKAETVSTVALLLFPNHPPVAMSVLHCVHL